MPHAKSGRDPLENSSEHKEQKHTDRQIRLFTYDFPLVFWLCWLSRMKRTCHIKILHWLKSFPCPPTDSIRAIMPILRLRGKVICCAALCMTVVHNDMHQGQIYGGGAVGVIPPFPPKKWQSFCLA